MRKKNEVTNIQLYIFNLFINYLKLEINSKAAKFADSIKVVPQDNED